jgi:hypothetical protein
MTRLIKVAARCEVQFDRSYSGTRARIRPGHGFKSLVSLCCVVPCRHRRCDGLSTHPGSPTARRKILRCCYFLKSTTFMEKLLRPPANCLVLNLI